MQILCSIIRFDHDPVRCVSGKDREHRRHAPQAHRGVDPALQEQSTRRHDPRSESKGRTTVSSLCSFCVLETDFIVLPAVSAPPRFILAGLCDSGSLLIPFGV